MEPKRSLLISVVSGKGGVGKTMLAVAVARELSNITRTLLVDLDFFNRGLTGLMRHGRVVLQITPPEFIARPSSSEQADTWGLVEVAPSLFHIRYPDLTPEQIQLLENYDVSRLASALKDFLHDVQILSKCEAVIIDCHGGPDQLSFAACLVSDYSLLVSEPDKITFYGTLHFLRQLRRVFPDNSQYQHPDVRLVFNKVVPAFSAVYLRKFYDKEIRRLFDNRPLLAVFPIEMYLTKEFERTPFLTTVYPFSLLAKKVRVLLRDLFEHGHSYLVPKSIRHASRLRLFVVRNSVARTPWILDLNKVMAIIAVGGVLIFAIQFYGQSLTQSVRRDYGFLTNRVQILEIIQYAQNHPEAIPGECTTRQSWEDRLGCWKDHKHQDANRGPRISDYMGNDKIREILGNTSELQSRRKLLLENPKLRSDPDKLIQNSYKAMQSFPVPRRYLTSAVQLYRFVDSIVESLALTAAAWFLIALVILWSNELDRAFTYSARVRHLTLACLIVGVALAMWFLPLLLLTIGLRESLATYSLSLRLALLNRTTILLVSGSLGVAACAILGQWFKAHQNFHYDSQRFEGISRVTFGCYVLAVPLLLWKIIR